MPSTAYGPYGQQPQNAPYQYQNPPFTPYNQGGSHLPTKRPSSGLRIAVIVIVALLVIFGVIAAIAIPAHNTQVANDNATATAQTNNVHSTATAVANAHVTATAQVYAYATATAVANTFPFSSNLQLNDPLNDNNHGYAWEQNTTCSFTGGAYHDTDTQANTIAPCSALKTNFKDFSYQATMQIKKGSLGGITFRGDAEQWHYYSFVIGSDGSYGLLLYTKQDTKPQTLHEGNTSVVGTQPVQVGVAARGGVILLYINKQQVAVVTDSTYPSGHIGVVSYNTGKDADVAFSNAQVWTL